ncbi:MAG TPA: glycosyltransferase family 2 protein [Anaerolineaceae bacterium]|nr:glycosyltransferase family 2 protein [Anaerolineaceae bacterium]
MTKPFFSVVILFWKSAQYLPRSLQALEEQTLKDFEVILLDNGSEEPPDPLVLAQHSNLNLHLLRSDTNLGFAAGNNYAVRCAKGDYLVLLNGDAFPVPNWLETISNSILTHPNHFFASRLIQADNPALLDGEWNVVHASGLAFRHNHNRPVSASERHPVEVMSACAAAGVYPREGFEEVAGFDEDFFAYMEDVDLDMRLQLVDYRCLYLPDAVVYHVGSGSTGKRSEFSTFYGQRNLIWTFVKNMPGLLFWLLLPAHLLANLIYIIAAFFMPTRKAIWRAKRSAVAGLSKMWRKRRLIQSKRTTSIWRFALLLNWNPFSPMIKLFNRKPSHQERHDRKST